MRQILIIAVAVLVIGGIAARFADKTVVHPSAQMAAVETEGRARSDDNYGRKLTLDTGSDGHYKAEARIAGRQIDFIVDTGASLVILRESDAAQVGIRPRPSDYTATVSTANGQIKAAPAKLERVEVGGITVYDVPALVLPDEALWKNLLGMSFLSRLKRYEVANGRMVLEQ